MKQKNIRTLKKKLQKIFHEFIRKRDLENGCISCGKRVPYGQAWHAGHFYPRSTQYASLWFDEQNTNGQCSYCNTYLGGNPPGYVNGLLKKYGKDILTTLELRKICSKRNIWTVFEYEAMIKKYSELNQKEKK